MSTTTTTTTTAPATKSRRRMVVVGSANQDLTSYTNKVPVLGETVMGSTFETSCGGKGANQARAAASLGICPVTMICRVGKDVFGDNLLRDFKQCGVEWDPTTTVLEQHVSSGVAMIVVDQMSGDNMIIVTPGANHELTPRHVKESLQSLKPTVVVVQLEIPYETALQALKTGREVGAITIFNPAPAPPQQGDDVVLQEFLPYVDILIPNETELRTICGGGGGGGDAATKCDEETMAKEILNRGVRQAVICTLGARGAIIVQRRRPPKTSDDASAAEEFQVDLVDAPPDLPARNQPVVDTVGAGDAFCGALSAYLVAIITAAANDDDDGIMDLSTLLPDAVQKSCGVASMSVRRRGASYPTAKELPDSLRVPGTTTATRKKPEITFVTGNIKKLEEVKQILSANSELAFDIVNVSLNLPELQGDPLEIAREKCRIATEQVQGACFTEDTSLCFHALNGMPGPYIKFFLEKCGHAGLNAMLAGFDDKTAYAQTVIAFCPGPGQPIVVFDGRTEGTIVPPRGPPDFGWDPIFQPHESNGLTYAEMEKTAKNKISHRGRAMQKFRTHLLEQVDGILQSMNG